MSDRIEESPIIDPRRVDRESYVEKPVETTTEPELEDAETESTVLLGVMGEPEDVSR